MSSKRPAFSYSFASPNMTAVLSGSPSSIVRKMSMRDVPIKMPLVPRLLADNQLRNRLQLHVGRAFVDGADLRVSPELFDGVVLDEAVAAVKLDGFGGDTLGDARRVELGHRRLLDEGEAGVLHPRGVVDHQPRRLKLGRHLGQLELDALELVDGLLELRPLPRIAQGML